MENALFFLVRVQCLVEEQHHEYRHEEVIRGDEYVWRGVGMSTQRPNSGFHAQKPAD